MGLKQIERSLVRRFDHRGIVVGRADQPSPRDLSSDEHLVRLRCILIGELKATVERQDATRLLRVDVVGPPPVIHHLRDPLVAEVLQQEVEECRRRVGRHHAATSERLLEHRDLRRGVHHQIAVLAVFVAPRQDRNDRHRRIGQVVPPRPTDDPVVRDPAIAQHGTHLAAVRGAVRSAEDERVSHQSPGRSRSPQRSGARTRLRSPRSRPTDTPWRR